MSAPSTGVAHEYSLIFNRKICLCLHFCFIDCFVTFDSATSWIRKSQNFHKSPFVPHSIAMKSWMKNMTKLSIFPVVFFLSLLKNYLKYSKNYFISLELDIINKIMHITKGNNIIIINDSMKKKKKQIASRMQCSLSLALFFSVPFNFFVCCECVCVCVCVL